MEVSRNKRPRYAVVDCDPAEAAGTGGFGREAAGAWTRCWVRVSAHGGDGAATGA